MFQLMQALEFLHQLPVLKEWRCLPCLLSVFFFVTFFLFLPSTPFHSLYLCFYSIAWYGQITDICTIQQHLNHVYFCPPELIFLSFNSVYFGLFLLCHDLNVICFLQNVKFWGSFKYSNNDRHNWHLGLPFILSILSQEI